MRFYVEQSPAGGWRVMLDDTSAPVSVHDTEEEARERLAAYVRGLAAAEAPTVETGVPRGARVALPDGTQILIRPIRADDKPLLLEAFHERLGDASRYRRFIGFKKSLSTRELAYLTELDHVDHEAIGAIDPETGRGIGVARFVREAPGAEIAEAAVTVVDEWQSRGVGGLLLDALVARARDVGITEFSASLLTENRAMLALFSRLGHMEVRHDAGATVRIQVRLPTGDGSLRAALRAAASGDVSR